MRWAVGIVGLLAACQGSDKRTSGSHTDLTAAIDTQTLRVAIGDLDGDHRNEIVACSGDALRVFDPTGKQLAALPIHDGIQKLVVADLDGDGSAEIYAGWGQTREHRDSKARVSVVHYANGSLTEQPIISPATTRDESVTLLPMLDTRTLLYAYFDSKYMVTSVVLARDGDHWTATPLAQIRTATSYARGDVDGDGKPDLVVGRVYGDDIGKDGDAFVLHEDGTRTPIPSTRGMRSIAVIDGAVYMGDGWHQDYGTMARGLFSRSTMVGGSFVTRVVEDTVGQFGIDGIFASQIAGQRAIVTVGNAQVRAFRPNADKWDAAGIAGVARDVAVGDLDGVPGDEVLILGETKTEIVSLNGVSWSPIK